MRDKLIGTDRGLARRYVASVSLTTPDGACEYEDKGRPPTDTLARAGNFTRLRAYACALLVFAIAMLVASEPGAEEQGFIPLATLSPATASATVGSLRKRLSIGFMRVVKSVTFIVVGVYVGLSLYMFVFQERVVFYPSRRVTMTPDRIGLTYEELELATDSGCTVSAWFVPADNPRGVVIFCHGNAGNIGDRLNTLEILNELGFSTLFFDYPGYGDSPGSPSERGTYDAAKAAWGFVIEERGVPPERVVVFGRSLGGSVAAWLAHTVKPAALVLEASFISTAEMGQDVYPYLPVRLLCRIKYPTRDYLRSVTCPVLVVHSEDDELIRFRHGEALYAAATAPKEFCRIVGSHNDAFLVSGKMYTEGLARFFDKHLGRAGSGEEEPSDGGEE